VLDRILNDLSEKVLFQTVKNTGPEARKANREIAQLKLSLANQQSRLAGGIEKLSEKCYTNVIASLSECRDEGFNSLMKFDVYYTGVELRRICAPFTLRFPECVANKGNGFAK
jgi:hypothetical protein